eukprot:2035325-Heterocapsa_arctica.AAC.1
MKLGYKFYRDYGNECYGDYLRHIATKAYKGGLITYLEHFSITKYNDANSGNILEAIMGYAWLYQNKKNPDLKDFPDIMNYMENEILKRATTDETEKKEEAMEESDTPNEDKTMVLMKDEMMVKLADIISAIMTTYLNNIEEAGEHREH